MPRNVWPPDLAAVVASVLRALPAQDRAALGALGEGEGYILCERHELPGKWADAGPADVRLRVDLVERFGADAPAVVAHELAHVLLKHSMMLTFDASPHWRAALEDEADEQAARWLGPAAGEALARHRR